MVKAVQQDKNSPNTQGNPPKQNTADEVTVTNPDAEVEFNIDFEEGENLPEAVSEKAHGGTELMRKWLFDEMEKKEPGLIDKFQIISTRVRNLDPTKQRILWIHDLAQDPEVQHLKHQENWGKYERVVFVSHWQQYQFRTHLGFPYDKGIVIQNAIHPIEPHEKPNDGTINVCYFSTPHRGLEVLLNAWDFMKKQLGAGKNAKLNVFSSFKIYDRPHLDEQFRHVYKRAQETEDVIYHGTVSNDKIREMLKTQHVMAYPSIYEETSCLCVVPNLGALPETGANFPWMYGWEEDPERQAHVHGHILARAIEHYWDGEVQNLLKIQQNYFDMFYNWSLRSGQWMQFLRAIEHEIPVIEDSGEEETEEKKDGDIS